jgi:hypothetical protein
MIHICTDKDLQTLVEERFLQTPPDERHGWHPPKKALQHPLVLPVYAEYSKEGDSAKIGVFVYSPQIALPSSLVVPDKRTIELLFDKQSELFESEHRWIEQCWLGESNHLSQYYAIRASSGSDKHPEVSSCTSFDFRHPQSRDEKYTEMLISAVLPHLREHDYTEYRLLNIIPSHEGHLPQIAKALSKQGYTQRKRNGVFDVRDYGHCREKRERYELQMESLKRQEERKRSEMAESWRNAM